MKELSPNQRFAVTGLILVLIESKIIEGDLDEVLNRVTIRLPSQSTTPEPEKPTLPPNDL